MSSHNLEKMSPNRNSSSRKLEGSKSPSKRVPEERRNSTKES